MVYQWIDAARARRIWGNRMVAVVVLCAFVVTGYLLYRATRSDLHILKLSAGVPMGHRYELAQILRDEAALHGIRIELVGSRGSKEDVELLQTRKLDLALIGGEVGHDEDQVREVAVLVSEPLHLFVKPELALHGTAALVGKRLNLGERETGVRNLAGKVLSFAGFVPGKDFIDLDKSYEELIEMSDEELPDGIFALSPLPWKLGSRIVHQRGYRMLELPYGDAMALSDRELHDFIVPAFSYSVVPPVPEKALHTVATPMLLAANRHVPPKAVERLMEVIFEGNFVRRANLPPLDAGAVRRVREFQVHQGTLTYLRRGDPVLNGQLIDSLENLRSFMVSGALSVFLFWRWYRRRKLIGFEAYFDAVSALEQDALTKERNGTLDILELRRIWQQLASVKTEVLDHQAAGTLSSDEQLVSFLTHVSDVRNLLDSLRMSHPVVDISSESITTSD